MRELIDNAPTVDIKDEIAGAYNEGYMCGNKEAEKARLQGEWIENNYGRIQCSICKGAAISTMTGCLVDRHLEQYKTKFCPNCGADMRKGGTEE